MKITRKQFIGSVALASAACMTGCKSGLSAESPVEGYGPVEANSPLTWLPERTLARGGDTIDDLTNFIDLEYGIHNSYWKDLDGWAIRIKPTGYRGLPLWPVSKLTVALDGQEINQNDILFNLHNIHFRIDELKNQWGAQWYCFDWATLFITKKGGLTVGSNHEVEVRQTSGSYNEQGVFSERESISSEQLSVIDTPVRMFW